MTSYAFYLDAVFYRTRGTFIPNLATEITFLNGELHIILKLGNLEIGYFFQLLRQILFNATLKIRFLLILTGDG